MKKTIACKVLAMLLSGLAMNAAVASMSGTATLSNLHYTLIDLDANDGITPSLVFENVGFTVMPTTTHVYANDADGVNNKVNKGIGSIDPVSATLSATRYNMTASISGANTLESTVLSTSLQINADNKSRFDYDSTAMLGTLQFTLSAHTAIIFDADASLSATSSGLLPGVNDGGVLATARILADFGGKGVPDSPFSLFAQAKVNQTAGSQGADLPVTDTNNQRLEFTFSNLSDKGIRGYVQPYIAVYASQELPYVVIPNPVPEPESFAMLLTGLGLVGFVARRSKKA